MKTTVTNKGKNAYVVCAKLRGNASAHQELSDVAAGQPAARRFNLIERVAIVYDGKLVRRTDKLMFIAFNTANASVLAGCEMLRRCNRLLNVSGNRLALRLGIHKAAPQSNTTALIPIPMRSERRDRKRRFGFDTASQLADTAADSEVLISGLVFNSLDPVIRKTSETVLNTTLVMPVHKVDWSLALPHQQDVSIHQLPKHRARQKLLIAMGSKRLTLDQEGSVTTFGRDPGCDVVLDNRFSSRIHARIEVLPDGFLLTDQSFNGTSVVLKDGTRILVKDSTFLLRGRGKIAFGSLVGSSDPQLFDFQISKA